MTRVRLISVLLCCCMVAVSAPAARTSSPEDGSERHFLWRAVGAKGTPVYLLGSIHALPKKQLQIVSFAFGHLIRVADDQRVVRGKQDILRPSYQLPVMVVRGIKNHHPDHA